MLDGGAARGRATFAAGSSRSSLSTGAAMRRWPRVAFRSFQQAELQRGAVSRSARGRRTAALGVRRDKAALSSGCKPHPATAPAGSNRSRHGGDEVSEAFG
jgi:hypothetical protein